MVKFKTTIRKQDHQKTKDGLYNVKISVSHKGATRYIGTEIYIEDTQILNGEIINHASAESYNIQLRNLRNLYSEKIIKFAGNIKEMTIAQLMDYLKKIDQKGRDKDFIFFAKGLIEELREQKRISYANSIQQTINILGKKSLLFSEITPAFCEDFYNRLYVKNKKINTIGIHLRNIRMIFNEAIRRGLVAQEIYPFRSLRIRSEKTRKRSLSIKDIRKIRDKKLKKESLRKARDLFMLSFYLNGINFKDLLLAKKQDVYQSRLLFNRAKTGKSYSIKIFPEAQKIIDRYQGEKYLLRTIEVKPNKKKDRGTPIYKDITDQVNRLLKTVSGLAKVNIPISTYFARHSLATIARNIGISKDDIRAILGHGQDTVTDIYIDLDQERIDDAMRKVLDEIK